MTPTQVCKGVDKLIANMTSTVGPVSTLSKGYRTLCDTCTDPKKLQDAHLDMAGNLQWFGSWLCSHLCDVTDMQESVRAMQDPKTSCEYFGSGAERLELANRFIERVLHPLGVTAIPTLRSDGEMSDEDVHDQLFSARKGSIQTLTELTEMMDPSKTEVAV